MANHHFGKFADVWKHLVLNEVLAGEKPERYAETHAGSAAYPVIDDAERRYGVLGFLSSSESELLAATPFTRVLAEYVDARPSLYPGSALQAMTALGDGSAYLLCDLDPESAQDLRTWASRLELGDCEVAEGDGMVAVREWLEDSLPAVVHIDPFDPFARQDGPSAIELATEVADAGHALVYWYGYSAPPDRAWAADAIGSTIGTELWCGDLMVTAADGSVRGDGDLGKATSAGTGSGVVLANVSQGVISRCEELANELARAYEGRRLPDGTPGRLDPAVS